MGTVVHLFFRFGFLVREAVMVRIRVEKWAVVNDLTGVSRTWKEKGWKLGDAYVWGKHVAGYKAVSSKCEDLHVTFRYPLETLHCRTGTSQLGQWNGSASWHQSSSVFGCSSSAVIEYDQGSHGAKIETIHGFKACVSTLQSWYSSCCWMSKSSATETTLSSSIAPSSRRPICLLVASWLHCAPATHTPHMKQWHIIAWTDIFLV